MTTETVDQPRLGPTVKRYVRVNGSWPATTLPSLTGPEAISAAKRLYRMGMGQAFKGKFQITSGNRFTWIRRGVFYVNPDRGWHALVHDISHLVHYRKHPARSAHDFRHSTLEREMIETVTSKGWLDGKLQRTAKPKPKPQDVRYARIVGRIKAWESKQKRAENALKKLLRQKAYYEKQRVGA